MTNENYRFRVLTKYLCSKCFRLLSAFSSITNTNGESYTKTGRATSNRCIMLKSDKTVCVKL